MCARSVVAVAVVVLVSNGIKLRVEDVHFQYVHATFASLHLSSSSTCATNAMRMEIYAAQYSVCYVCARVLVERVCACVHEDTERGVSE